MKSTHLNTLLKKRMTRKEFLGLSVFALASVFGIVGVIEELTSHAATPFLSEEAEGGTVTTPATIITDTNASGGKAVKFMAASNPSGKKRTWLSGYAGDLTASGRATWNSEYPKLQVTNTYMDYETSWADRAASIGYNQPNWLPAVSDGSAVNVLTIGLLLETNPNASKAPNMPALAAAANGTDTSFTPGFVGIANKINSLGMNSPSTVIRLGHEMDGNWYPWGTSDNPPDAANYAAAYRRAVTAMRTVCPLLRFNICYCSGGQISKLANHYPGDEYVDFVSMDFYDAEVKTQAAFTASFNGLGFAELGAFAHAHNKLFSFDEWAINGNDANQATRDNPVFVQGMWDGFTGLNAQYPNIVGYDSYFNEAPNFYLTPPSTNPKTSALYTSLWSS